MQTHSSTNVLVVNPKVPVSTLPEFIAYVKSGKYTVNYGTAGHGSSQHLAGALFNHMVGGNMVMVPYKGGAPAVTDLVGGAIEAVFAPLIEALPFIKSGAIKPLAVCGAEALAAPAQRAADGRFPSRISVDVMGRHHGAGQNASRYREQDERGGRESAESAERQDALRRGGQGDRSAARRRSSGSSSRPKP